MPRRPRHRDAAVLPCGLPSLLKHLARKFPPQQHTTGRAAPGLPSARFEPVSNLVNTLRQVGTATGVALIGALYASRITTATLHALTGLPAPPGAAQRLAAAAAFAALGAIAGFAYGPDPARQPPPSPAPGDHSAQAAQPATAQHQAHRPAEPETTPP